MDSALILDSYERFRQINVIEPDTVLSSPKYWKMKINRFKK